MIPVRRERRRDRSQRKIFFFENERIIPKNIHSDERRTMECEREKNKQEEITKKELDFLPWCYKDSMTSQSQPIQLIH
jgi:hypothetical protein